MHPYVIRCNGDVVLVSIDRIRDAQRGGRDQPMRPEEFAGSNRVAAPIYGFRGRATLQAEPEHAALEALHGVGAAPFRGGRRTSIQGYGVGFGSLRQSQPAGEVAARQPEIGRT